MKQISFGKEYKVEKSQDPSEFAHYVRLTSEMIERPYMVTFKMVEQWQEHKIIRRYNEAMTRTEKNE